jgi:hypothetical protein
MVTQADIDNLNTAIANDTRQVTLGGQSVTYRSIDELTKARDDLVVQKQKQDIASGAVQPRPKRIVSVHGGRGY